MSRFARCAADEVGIYAGDRSRRLGRGAFVDLDEVIVPASDERPAETLRDVLGGRSDAFEIFDDVDTLDAAMAEAARRDAAASAASMTASDATPAPDPSPAATFSNSGSRRRAASPEV